MNHRISLRQFLPLAGITISAFLFNTSEFMPIGLLTSIASDFQITEAQAGVMISAYSWAVTILSLPLMLLACKIEYRKLLLITLGVFCLGQALSAFSSQYALLTASRICVACAHSVFWSIAAPMAVQLVEKEHRSAALSMVATGTSIAMILGLPLGRVIGLYIGWRMTFLTIGIIAFLTLVYIWRVFPRIPSRSTFSVRQLPELVKNPVLIRLYGLTVVMATAYYTGYSYIEPFLQQTAGMSEEWITLTLTVFGLSGLGGSILFSRCYGHFRFGLLRLSFICMTMPPLLLHAASGSLYAVMVLCAVLGMAATTFNVSFQAELIQHTSLSAAAVAMSIFSGIFNLGIGSGTWIGGMISTYSSIAYIGYAGGGLATAASAYCIFSFIKRLKQG